MLQTGRKSYGQMNLLSVALKKRNPQLSNVHKLEKAAKEECNKLPQKVYRNLILSMPNHIQAVISANGGNTNY